MLPKILKTKLPIYLPDATLGVVRSLDTEDLKKCGIEGMVVNTYHLMLEMGLEKLTRVGGIKKFMNFEGLVASDSGGFQIMSLLHTKRIKGKIMKEGITFEWVAQGRNQKFLLTPESSIALQFAIGADVMICFDYFTRPEADKEEIKKSVEWTIEWAKRSKEAFNSEVEKRKLSEKNRPLLVAPIQGGDDSKLREVCAKALVTEGFDGYGYGGWPLDSEGRFNEKVYAHNASLSPSDKLRFALGVGKPDDIARGFALGYDIFDCVLPTRDARHGRLYVLKDNFDKIADLAAEKFYDYLYISRGSVGENLAPVSKTCDCFTCQNHSRSYLHHLFKIQDALGWRLATIHNLRTYVRVINKLRDRS